MPSIHVETENTDIAFWQLKARRNLSEEDSRKIKENIVGFFSLLIEWEENAK